MNLLDLVNQKAQSLDVQYSKAEVVPADEIPWKQAKDRVEKLPANLDLIAGEMKKKLNQKDGVRMDSYGRCGKEKCYENTTRIEFTVEEEPYLMLFISYSCPKHGTKNAQYVTLNPSKNSVYRRRLIVNYEAQL